MKKKQETKTNIEPDERLKSLKKYRDKLVKEVEKYKVPKIVQKKILRLSACERLLEQLEEHFNYPAKKDYQKQIREVEQRAGVVLDSKR